MLQSPTEKVHILLCYVADGWFHEHPDVYSVVSPCRCPSVLAPAVGALCPAASLLNGSRSSISFWKGREEDPQPSGGSRPPAWRVRRVTHRMGEEEDEWLGAPTGHRGIVSVSSVTPPVTARPATAPPATARHATATPATKGGTASAATPACPPWTATGSLAALSSPPRMRRRRMRRRVPSSQCMMLATGQRVRRRVAQEETDVQGGGRRPRGESRGSGPGRGPARGPTLVR